MNSIEIIERRCKMASADVARNSQGAPGVDMTPELGKWEPAHRRAAKPKTHLISPNALESSGGRFIQAHSSGHIHAADIVRFVNELAPRRVIPIHTTAPQRFAELFPNTLLLPDGESLDLAK